MSTNLPVSQPVEILIEARRLLEERGWVQGHWEYQGKYCILGAVNEARKKHGLGPVRHNGFWGTLMAWNDKAGRTKGEVLKLFGNMIAGLLGIHIEP